MCGPQCSGRGENPGEPWVGAALPLSGHYWTGLDTTGQDWTGLDRTGQDWTGLDTAGQDWTGQYNTLYFLVLDSRELCNVQYWTVYHSKRWNTEI